MKNLRITIEGPEDSEKNYAAELILQVIHNNNRHLSSVVILKDSEMVSEMPYEKLLIDPNIIRILTEYRPLYSEYRRYTESEVREIIKEVKGRCAFGAELDYFGYGSASVNENSVMAIDCEDLIKKP